MYQIKTFSGEILREVQDIANAWLKDTGVKAISISWSAYPLNTVGLIEERHTCAILYEEVV